MKMIEVPIVTNIQITRRMWFEQRRRNIRVRIFSGPTNVLQMKEMTQLDTIVPRTWSELKFTLRIIEKNVK